MTSLDKAYCCLFPGKLSDSPLPDAISVNSAPQNIETATSIPNTTSGASSRTPAFSRYHRDGALRPVALDKDLISRSRLQDGAPLHRRPQGCRVSSSRAL